MMWITFVAMLVPLNEAYLLGTNYNDKEYSAAVYNDIPHFWTTHHNGKQNDAEIQALGKIFVDHQVHDDFGLSLVHKHFDLEPGERIIERIYDNISISFPVVVSNMTTDVFAHKYQYNDGGWIPLEFSKYTDYNPAIRRRYMKLTQNENFLLELGEKLTEMSLESVFGVGINTRDHFYGSSTWETTRDGRKLIVTPHKQEFALCGLEAPTFWTFERYGDDVVVNKC
eukprot:UN01605